MNKLCMAVSVALLAASARASEVSPPRNTTLAIYDSGFALVSESRVATLAGQESQVQIKPLPARLDPQTISFEPAGGGKGFELIEQRFEDDLASPEKVFQRFQNRPVQVKLPDGIRQGKLVSFPRAASKDAGLSPFQMIQNDGALLSFNDASRIGEVTFPDAEKIGYLAPTLIWQVKSAQEGPQNIRLNYLAYGLRWDSSYELVLAEDGRSVRLALRIGLKNGSGGSFRDARVKLLLTEQGLSSSASSSDAPLSPVRPYDPTAQPPQRFAYGVREPQPENMVASLAPVESYELPRPVTLDAGETVYVQMQYVERVPAARFYVYDGVRFDRFQRNRRNDWNYGTEYQPSVDTHLEFENTAQAGLGVALPPGVVSLYQRNAQGALDLLGRESMRPVAAGGKGQVRLGPARGLRGERERTAYSEVKPLHEYEESFEVRLANDSDQTVVVRVVEHLYRWSEYEIVKSDLEYQATGPQTIEFQPEIKPGGRRTIHYTVRYRW